MFLSSPYSGPQNPLLNLSFKPLFTHAWIPRPLVIVPIQRQPRYPYYRYRDPSELHFLDDIKIRISSLESYGPLMHRCRYFEEGYKMFNEQGLPYLTYCQCNIQHKCGLKKRFHCGNLRLSAYTTERSEVLITFLLQVLVKSTVHCCAKQNPRS